MVKQVLYQEAVPFVYPRNHDFIRKRDAVIRNILHISAFGKLHVYGLSAAGESAQSAIDSVLPQKTPIKNTHSP